jgi:vacuolar-type H+-ATPase subunit E/Vma4
MALDDLLAALERDAAAQAAAARAEAHAAADRIAHETDARLAGRRRDVLDARAETLRAAAALVLGDVRRRTRGQVLAAREALLERLMDAARARLPEVARGTEYRAALPERLREALSYLGDEAAVVRCPSALAGTVRAALPVEARATVVPDDAVGSGFRAARADGGVEIDETLEARLADLRPRLVIEILRRLDAEAR